MSLAVSPTQSNTLTALRSFLVSILATDVEVIQGQPNRVPEPKKPNFVVMTPMRRPRLSTNVDVPADVRFTGSIAAAVLTVTAVQIGTIVAGRTLFGTGVAAGSVVGAQLTGTPGGIGTYAVSPSQTVASRTLACGVVGITTPTMVAVQLDVHGPVAGDNAQLISTLFRDPYATKQFAAQSPAYDVTPLYADDPKQVPFYNDQQQVEDRWVVEALLQVNPVVSVPQQFADSVSADVISVDASYPQ